MNDLSFEDIKIFQNTHFEDDRGIIYTSWYDKYFDDIIFNMDKIVISKFKALRGLHGDYKSTKLLTCTYGEVFYVFIDNRIDSPKFKQACSTILSSKDFKTILIPPGFATGVLTLSEISILNYKYAFEGEYPDVEDQFSFKWNDSNFDIKWPLKDVILSERDK